MKLARRDLLIGLGAVLAVGCRREGTPAEPPDRGKILGDLTTNVIVPTYSDAVTDATALEASVKGLRDAPAADALRAARAAWKRARATWKPSDAFRFGPANDLGVTGNAIDAPPYDAAKIEAFVAGDAPIDAAAIAKLGANQKGFGGLEVLLFDRARDDDATVAAFEVAGGRRGAMAALVAAELRTKISAVRDAWTNGYARELATAGRGSATFASEHQGIDIVVNALVAAAEALVALHIAAPLGIDQGGPPKPDLVESPRADVSLDDALAELAGIEAVYLGRRSGTPGLALALADAVAERSAGADSAMKTALARADAALRAISGPLRTAVVERRDSVRAAYDAGREVERALTTEVAGALGTSLGFTVTDGD